MSTIDLRYSRLTAIPEIGEEGIEKLRKGKVMIVGCGALGSVCAMYLAASGVGTLGIADFDTIDISNLQRQVFFSEKMLGQEKAGNIKSRIEALNSDVEVKLYPFMVTRGKASEIFKDYDFIIDGSDNQSTKIMTATVCTELGVPYCIGGVEGFRGQAMSWKPGSIGYADIFGENSTSCGMTPCSVKGVLGPCAGIIACVEAAEAIKYLSGAGDPLFDKLFTVDLLQPEARVWDFS